MRKNTKGSTLVAAIAVIMIIMIILGASLTIASSYYQRSINENTKKQVYISAKSYAEVISAYIRENEEKLIPIKADEKKIIQSIETDDEKMKISGYVLRIDDTTLKIVVKSEFDDFNYEFQTIMKYRELQWVNTSYCESKAGDELC